MNIYFLVEGKQTEKKVYPRWLAYLIPNLEKVQWHHQVINNNYCLFSGEGFPSILNNHLKNSIEDVNESGNFDYLVICLDSDDDTVEERKQKVIDFINEEDIKLNSTTELIIIVQNKCFETWFLGNSKIFKSNPSSKYLLECIKHYNVRDNDPELMSKPKQIDSTTSIYHSSYLRELLNERNIQYSKKNPQGVMDEPFLKELIKRNVKTSHIKSFKEFVDFCEKVNSEI